MGRPRTSCGRGTDEEGETAGPKWGSHQKVDNTDKGRGKRIGTPMVSLTYPSLLQLPRHRSARMDCVRIVFIAACIVASSRSVLAFTCSGFSSMRCAAKS